MCGDGDGCYAVVGAWGVTVVGVGGDLRTTSVGVEARLILYASLTPVPSSLMPTSGRPSVRACAGSGDPRTTSAGDSRTTTVVLPAGLWMRWDYGWRAAGVSLPVLLGAVEAFLGNVSSRLLLLVGFAHPDSGAIAATR